MTNSSPGTSRPAGEVLLRLLVPESVYLQVRRAEARCERLAGVALSPEECLFLFLKFFAREATPQDRRLGRKRLAALERAGWRCEVPGCTSRCNLQVHHVVFRSHGGEDSLENFCVTCAAHHLRHIHLGRMRVEGEDPEDRIWEVGLEDGDPYRVYQGDRLVYAWDEQEDPASDGRVCEAEVEYRVAAA